MKHKKNIKKAKEAVQPPKEEKTGLVTIQEEKKEGDKMKDIKKPDEKPKKKKPEKNIEVITVVDCTFHPKCFTFANGNPAFKNMLCNSAMEGADRLLKNRDFYMDKDYKLMTEYKCFNEEPALLPVNINTLRGKKWRKKKREVAAKLAAQGGRKFEKTTK